MATRSKRRQRAEQLDWIVERVTASANPSFTSNVEKPVSIEEMGGHMLQIARTWEHRSKSARVLEIAWEHPPLLLQWALENRRKYTLLCGWRRMSRIAGRHPQIRVYAGSLAAFSAGHENAFDWVLCSEPSKEADGGIQIERLARLCAMLGPAGLLTHRESFRPPALSWFRYREQLDFHGVPPLHRISLGDGTFLVTCQKIASIQHDEGRNKKKQSSRKAA